MLHFFNCKKLKYIHDEPYTLTDSKNRKIKLKKGDVLILDDGAMYRSLKYKTRLFIELGLEIKAKESKKTKDDLLSLAKQPNNEQKLSGKEEKEEKEDNPSATEEVSNKE
ncbi:hypothetical protein [uncultured Helicobacter sp.]|uniref:hypothetical protein n=1 Tax=uncultured Helicobacter sp. TaxID=175537 RepID=UPI0026252E29|nr:hypothetical protein [uncultured Helicobacter sp.]